MKDYCGYREILLDNKSLAEYYEGKLDFPILENEYLAIYDQERRLVELLVRRGSCTTQTKYKNLKPAYFEEIKPKNTQQKMAMNMLQNEEIKVKLLTGVYGSGKDYLMLAHALNLINKGNFDKLIYIRNNIEVKDTSPLGALPGGMEEKLFYFSGPLIDHMGGLEGYRRLMEERKLEILHLGFLRGRDLRNSIIYCTEAENLTKEHIQLLLGRVGEGSQLWLNGDCRQRDRTIFERSAGLESLVNGLKGHHLFGYVNMPITERSEVARLADLLDQ